MSETQAIFLAETKAEDIKRHMEALLICYAAPVLKKVKPAALVIIKPEQMPLWDMCAKNIREAASLCIARVKIKEDSVSMLIFDKEALRQALQDNLAQTILRNNGYPVEKGMGACVRFLKARMEKEDFPHEIGLFLGYPPEDVCAFIKNNGQNCTCCRYWKVYSDVERAKKIWAQIDEARGHALETLRRLLPIQETVKTLMMI